MDSDDSPERKPPRGLASRDAPSPGRRYSVFVGIAFVAFAIFALVNTLSSDEGDLLGSDPAEAGAPLAPFSVPDALGSLVGDANVFQDDCDSSRNPCPPGDRRTPACEVEGEGVIRVCDLFDRPLAISFWFTRGGDCLPSQDAFDAVAERYGDRVNFLSVNVRDDREEVREIVRERGWEVPVGYDADGAVANVYRVGGCPTAALAYPGGILAAGVIGEDGVRRGGARQAHRRPDRRVAAARDHGPMSESIDDILRAAERRSETRGAGESVAGVVAPELAEEFPGLALRSVLVERGSGRSPKVVKERLRLLSDRFTGAQAITLRQKPIPWAYRVFFRHIGLDPDRTLTPVEQMSLDRMRQGSFKSQNLLDDALTIAVVESGVALRAFDADKVTGRLALRGSDAGEALAGRPGELPLGTLVVADELRPLALLFGATGEGLGVHPRTKRTLLVAIQVKGVSDIVAEEALWMAATVMDSA